MNELLLAIFGAVVGAALQIYLPIWRDQLRYSRKKQILGDWLSSWQPTTREPDVWLSERVRIDATFGKLKLTSEANSHGYQWQGEGELLHDSYFNGSWRSTKRGSNSAGVFSFYLLPQGDAIVGQALGPDLDGAMLNSNWAMGRDERALERAKKWIHEH